MGGINTLLVMMGFDLESERVILESDMLELVLGRFALELQGGVSLSMPGGTRNGSSTRLIRRGFLL